MSGAEPARIRIVFVDDELNVIRAMQRTLHCMRNEWDMEFLSSGAAALQSLEKRDADIVVSDMRMPSMDGWQLLAEVKRRHPQTVRFLLSGHTDPSSIMRAVGTAHQYLAKPCDTPTLKAAIAQTQMLRQLLSSESMASLVGEVDLLPSAPKAFQEILACIQRPDASLADAARVVGRDVAMTANIMKLVNSAFFGARQSICNVERAVACLGLDTLCTLVLGQGICQSQLAVRIEGFSLEQLWTHSWRTASVARIIACSEGLAAIKAEEAFLAGMLHDVGKIVFATRAAPAGALAASSADCELAQMQAHHAEVGAYLLGLWGFPNSIVAAVAQHHRPGDAPDTQLGLAAIVHIADQLAHRGDAGAGDRAVQIEAGLLERLGLEARLPVWQATLAALDAGQSPQ